MINEEDEYWSKLLRTDEYISEPVIDSNTGMVLDTDMVREVRQEELNWVHRQGIYVYRSKKPKRPTSRSYP